MMDKSIASIIPDGRTIPLSFGTMAYLHYGGTGKSVLLLHGNSSCKEAFARVIPAMRSHGLSIIAPDLPGHGDSHDARDAKIYGFVGYAMAVRELLSALAVTEYVVVGWSLGGHVAMELAASDPSCQALMLIGSPPGKPSPEALAAAFHTTADTLLAGKGEFSSDDVDTYAHGMYGEEVDPFLKSKVMRTDPRAREQMFRRAMAGEGVDGAAVVGQPSLPTAVVHGMKDPFVRADYLLSIQYGNLWRNRIAWLADSGHAPHWDSPDHLTTLICEFIDHIDTEKITG